MVIERGKSPPTPSQNMVAVAGDDLHVLLWKRMDWLGKENPLEGTIFGAQRCKREDWEKHEGFLPLAHVLEVQSAYGPVGTASHVPRKQDSSPVPSSGWGS